MEVPASVRALGHADHREMGALLRDADVFLELSEWQALGLTTLDAMACGCVPVVATSSEVGGGVVEHGVDALVVANRSEAAVVEATGLLVRSQRERRRLQRGGVGRLGASRFGEAAVARSWRAALPTSTFATCRSFAH